MSGDGSDHTPQKGKKEVWYVPITRIPPITGGFDDLEPEGTDVVSKLAGIQNKFNAIMTGEAKPTDPQGRVTREKEKPELFEEYSNWDSEQKLRAQFLASAAQKRLRQNENLEGLESAVTTFNEGLNYADLSLVRQAALVFLQDNRYARENLKLLPVHYRFGNW